MYYFERSFPMNIFSKLFKKRNSPESSDNFKVILKTKKKLSEEQRNAIISIVKNAIRSGEDFSTIGILIIMNADIHDPVILNRIKNGVEVII